MFLSRVWQSLSTLGSSQFGSSQFGSRTCLCSCICMAADHLCAGTLVELHGSQSALDGAVGCILEVVRADGGLRQYKVKLDTSHPILATRKHVRRVLLQESHGVVIVSFACVRSCEAVTTPFGQDAYAKTDAPIVVSRSRTPPSRSRRSCAETPPHTPSTKPSTSDELDLCAKSRLGASGPVGLVGARGLRVLCAFWARAAFVVFGVRAALGARWGPWSSSGSSGCGACGGSWV